MIDRTCIALRPTKPTSLPTFLALQALLQCIVAEIAACMAEGRSTVAFGLLLQDAERATARQRNKTKGAESGWWRWARMPADRQTDGESVCGLDRKQMLTSRSAQRRTITEASTRKRRPSFLVTCNARTSAASSSKTSSRHNLDGRWRLPTHAMCLSHVSDSTSVYDPSAWSQCEQISSRTHIWAAHVYVYSSSPHLSRRLRPLYVSTIVLLTIRVWYSYLM